MAENDGGPAFPCAAEWGVGEAPFVQPGMTLRQWYAGQALSGLVSGMGIVGEAYAADVVRTAVQLADALVAATAEGMRTGGTDE